MPGSLISGTETNLPVQVAPGLGSERELRDLVLGRGADGQPLRVEALLDVRRGDVTPLPFHVAGVLTDCLHDFCAIAGTMALAGAGRSAS